MNLIYDGAATKHQGNTRMREMLEFLSVPLNENLAGYVIGRNPRKFSTSA